MICSLLIDLFSPDKVDLHKIKGILNQRFKYAQTDITDERIVTEVNGLRVEIYPGWSMAFKKDAVVADGIRMASLEDWAAFKLSAITGRREKKDSSTYFSCSISWMHKLFWENSKITIHCYRKNLYCLP